MGLLAAKKKEVASPTGSIETKTARVGELGVEIVSMEQDASDTAEALAEDTKFTQDLEKNCAEKTGIHEAEKKVRAEEGRGEQWRDCHDGPAGAGLGQGNDNGR